jgi:uncharacterized protein YggE
MHVSLTPTYRALALGGIAGAVLIGAFMIGTGAGRAAPSPAGQHSSGAQQPSGAQVAGLVSSSAGPAKITVTGTGTVNGTPDQLALSMGVQVTASSVGSALQEASQAISRVTAVLKTSGVAAADIQTSGLYIQPDYRDSSPAPDGYGVSESLNATLRHLSTAGGQISAAVRAGGNAVTVSGISLNLADTSSLLARARASAIADARAKAVQYARALGQQLGPVVSVTDQAPVQPFPYAAAGSASSSSRAAPVPISPGTQQLSVSVTVVYALP